EARRRQCQLEEPRRFVAILDEGAQRSAESVRIGIERQFDGRVVKGGLKRLAIELAGPLVEKTRHHVGYTRLAIGVLRGPADEGKAPRHDRHGVLLDEPGLDTFRTDDALGLRGLKGRIGGGEEQDEKCSSEAAERDRRNYGNPRCHDLLSPVSATR